MTNKMWWKTWPQIHLKLFAVGLTTPNYKIAKTITCTFKRKLFFSVSIFIISLIKMCTQVKVVWKYSPEVLVSGCRCYKEHEKGRPARRHDDVPVVLWPANLLHNHPRDIQMYHLIHNQPRDVSPDTQSTSWYITWTLAPFLVWILRY